MKKFKDVENERLQYQQSGNQNSIHRASLMVPEIEGAVTQISFLNHFLIKRSYDNVACRITGIDINGVKLNSYLYKITEPIVYTFDLSKIFESQASSYIVEFFTSENLFISFPAVMVNHYGEGFANMVHAYNRVMNDIFEDDMINEIAVNEAAIDVQIDESTDTFILFNAGQIECKSNITFELTTEDEILTIDEKINVRRFNTQKFEIGKLFKIDDINPNSVLKVKQPLQTMFYGRLFAGQFKKDSEAFSANHSYYDSSLTKEYWDNNKPSARAYPFFKELNNLIRIHPIMSPCMVNIFIVLYSMAGNKLGEFSIGQVNSPSGVVLEENINQLAKFNNIDIDNIACLEIIAKPENGNTPTRISHQLVYQNKKSLYSSINFTLDNPNGYTPPNRRCFSWGQVIVNEESTSYLGVSQNTIKNVVADLTIEFYDETGILGTLKEHLITGGAILLNIKDVLNDLTSGSQNYSQNIWYLIRSENPNIHAVAVVENNISGHCTGEHSF